MSDSSTRPSVPAILGMLGILGSRVFPVVASIENAIQEWLCRCHVSLAWASYGEAVRCPFCKRTLRVVDRWEAEPEGLTRRFDVRFGAGLSVCGQR